MYIASLEHYDNSVDAEVILFKSVNKKDTLLKMLNYLIKKEYIDPKNYEDIIEPLQSIKYVKKMVGKECLPYDCEDPEIFLDDLTTDILESEGWMYYSIVPFDLFEEEFYILEYNNSEMGWETAFDILESKKTLWERLNKFLMEDEYNRFEDAPKLPANIDQAIEVINKYNHPVNDYMGLELSIKRIKRDEETSYES